MTEQDLRQVFDLADRRNAALYGFLRHVLLLASGALTVLVSLQAGAGSTGMALWAMRATWTLLAAGILLGSAALYGEVWALRRLATRSAESIRAVSRRRASGEHGASYAPVITGPPPWWIRAGEQGCYWSLSGAVVCLVVFAWIKG